MIDDAELVNGPIIEETIEFAKESKLDRIKQFGKKHERTITTVAIGGAAFAIGVSGFVFKDNEKMAEILRNLRVELDAESLGHLTAIEFIDYKKLRPQFEKFALEMNRNIVE